MFSHSIYDAFGRVTSESNPTIDSLFFFTGRPFDSDTQLQNNLNRWYDAGVGRWLSEDPIGFNGGSPNLYGYVTNAPNYLTDPSGTICLYRRPSGTVSWEGPWYWRKYYCTFEGLTLISGPATCPGRISYRAPAVTVFCLVACNGGITIAHDHGVPIAVGLEWWKPW